MCHIWILYGSCKPKLTNNTLIVLVMSPHVLCFFGGYVILLGVATGNNLCLLNHLINVCLLRQQMSTCSEGKVERNPGCPKTWGSYMCRWWCVFFGGMIPNRVMCAYHVKHIVDSINHQVPRILQWETGSLTWSMLRWWHQKPKRLWWAVQHVHLVWWELAPEWFGDEKCQHRRALPLWRVVIDVHKGFSTQISQAIHWLNAFNF